MGRQIVVNCLKGIAVKRKKSSFTLVELLTVVVIIAIVVAMLVPALTVVRKMAKEAQQRAQLTTIEMALTAFKQDYGDYPPSDCTLDGTYNVATGDYLGAQKLAEALVGWDLMGFHPKSAWRADGYDAAGGNTTYDPARVRGDDTLKERKGPYLRSATANAFQLNQLFAGLGPLAPSTSVLCDVFGKKLVNVGGKGVKAGAPILYYRANTSSKTIDASSYAYQDLIYDVYDNDMLIAVKEMDDGLTNPLADTTNNHEFFYGYISDPKIPVGGWPFNPESYLLISAGADGQYGTKDDICNFDPNLPG
jgi:type II secretory pathway pseudopilin PulG